MLPNAIVTWTSSERAVATVSEVGLVQAIAPGRAQIRATIKNINGADSVIVLAPAPKAIVSLTLSLGDSSLVVGETASATATAKDSSGAVVDWAGRWPGAWIAATQLQRSPRLGSSPRSRRGLP
ncbi:MAG: Ig-like domain-containing protein [Gemmatimonadetes bacterium]|nr:Ig-like domain-containing protein [Gemmatimonadota bacterium]